MGAEGVIDQRLGMLKSAHLRRRTMMGSCSRDLVWGDATRHANLGVLLANYVVIVVQYGSVE